VERSELFDLAVNRSLSYTKSIGLETSDKERLKQGLEDWYLKTRFAYRISLEDIVAILQSYSGEGSWVGGKNGKWQIFNKP
jgi:hypothetical protein